jgi:hypothetical protein
MGGSENDRGAVARRGDLTVLGHYRHGSNSKPSDSDEPTLDFAIVGCDRRAYPRPADISCRVVEGPQDVWVSTTTCFRSYLLV